LNFYSSSLAFDFASGKVALFHVLFAIELASLNLFKILSVLRFSLLRFAATTKFFEFTMPNLAMTKILSAWKETNIKCDFRHCEAVLTIHYIIISEGRSNPNNSSM